ncbi:MAG TPA: CpsB/CapC family capsule biosynthesis tyrosine phosphatase [Acholeplasma sp.]|nr:CpsB/CapC family capsule biosynthesis tyrosine phosphatase [Acholeplasma sp.]
MGINIHTSMTDIHCHILPNVDDGANSLETAISMIKKQILDGVTTIVLTPHVRSFRKEKQALIDSQYQLLKTEVEKQKLAVKLILGKEIYYNNDTVEHVSLMAFENTNYTLVEFSTVLETPIEEAAFNIKTLKLIPIIAHIERYEYLKKHDYLEIKKSGAVIQVNSSAILGLDGRKRKQAARYLLKKELVDVVSSDSHNMDTRKPNLLEAYTYVSKKYSKTYADKIFKENPESVVLNKKI